MSDWSCLQDSKHKRDPAVVPEAGAHSSWAHGAVGEGFLSKPVVCINLKNCTFSYFSFHSGIINQRKNLFVSITNCAGEI